MKHALASIFVASTLGIATGAFTTKADHSSPEGARECTNYNISHIFEYGAYGAGVGLIAGLGIEGISRLGRRNTESEPPEPEQP